MILAVLLACAAGPPTVRGVDAHGVPLPAGAVARFGVRRWRTRGPLERGHAQVAISPDGKAVFACGAGGLTVWRRADGVELPGPPDADRVGAFHFVPGKAQVILVRFLTSLDGATFTSYTLPGWKPVPGAARSVGLPARTDWTPPPWSAFSPDGKRAVLCLGDSFLLDTTVAGPLNTVGPGGRRIALASFAPDGGSVILAHNDGGVGSYRPTDGRGIRTLSEAEADGVDQPLEAVLSHESSALFSCRPTSSLLVRLDLKSRRRIRRYVRGGDVLALAPDGKELFVVGRNIIHVLDARSLRVVRIARLVREAAPLAVAVSPDGKDLLVLTDVGVRVLDATTGKPRHREDGHIGPIRHLAFSPEGRWLATGADDGAVLLWDTLTGRLTRKFEGHALGVASLAFSPDGRSLAVGDGATARLDADREATVRVWDVPTGARRWETKAHVGRVGSLAFIDGGKALVTAGPDDRVRWWATADGKRLGEDRFCASPTIMPGGDGKTAVIHEARSPGGLWKLGPGDEAPRSVNMASGGGGGRGMRGGGRMEVAGQELVQGGRMVLVRVRGEFVWLDLSSGDVGRSVSLPAPDRVAGPQRFSPDGELVAVGAQAGYGAISLYEARSGRSLGAMAEQYGGSLALEFSPNGEQLASAGPDGVVMLWDVAQVRLQAALDDWVGPTSKGLARRTDRAVARLAGALKAAARLELALPGYLKRLGDDSFEVREQASQELAKIGPAALIVLLRAKTPTDPEVRERVRMLVGRYPLALRQRAGSVRWVSDAMMALRRAGTEEARKALRELARMGDDTLIGREASFALPGMK
jgi:WD40 repeat protein